ncbi:MAG: hypothetical protein ETSY1_33685 [Candidatus Entotheonella factor]|uniref:Uncharacterized protein n=1 Tax=Entotheonella factor TaxID=1429438 RepID=W4LAG9_ENTF1|nr:MAG: hypothetical protein ETSY1_33685 [Candidatus Entotheonella factor]
MFAKVLPAWHVGRLQRHRDSRLMPERSVRKATKKANRKITKQGTKMVGSNTKMCASTFAMMMFPLKKTLSEKLLQKSD